jgi:hypothetical protein
MRRTNWRERHTARAPTRRFGVTQLRSADGGWISPVAVAQFSGCREQTSGACDCFGCILHPRGNALGNVLHACASGDGFRRSELAARRGIALGNVLHARASRNGFRHFEIATPRRIAFGNASRACAARNGSRHFQVTTTRGLVAAEGHASLRDSARKPNRKRSNGASVTPSGFGCVSSGLDAIAFSALNSVAGWRSSRVMQVCANRRGSRIENAAAVLRLLRVHSDAFREVRMRLLLAP